MGGITSVLVGLFGVLWTILVASTGGGFFALFGVIFTAVAVVQAIYNFKNATGKNRYSAFDITDDNEEPDPLDERFGYSDETGKHTFSSDADSNFCPYCGTRAEVNFEFCHKCGKKLP